MDVPLLFTTLRLGSYRVGIYISRFFQYPSPLGLYILCIKVGFRILFEITFGFRNWLGRRFICDALGLCEMRSFSG